MQKARITVSVQPETVQAAEARVAEGDAASVSAWVDEAMGEKLDREDLLELLSEMRAESGPATEEEEAWARNVLGL